MKKIYCLLLSVILLLSLFVPCTYAAEGGILTELSQVIDLSDYPANPADSEVYLITVMEDGYNGKDFDAEAGLYVYFYNPSRKSFEKTHELNKISMGKAWDDKGMAISYTRHNLTLIESTSDRVFVKAKVVDSPKGLARETAGGGRQYDVSEIELYEDGNYNAKAYRVGYSYVFSGYGDALRCIRTSNLTIDLDVRATSYLTGDSAKGRNYSNMVSSVYFSVPKAIEAKYGRLYSIDYEAYKYYTSPMILMEKPTSIEDRTLANAKASTGKLADAALTRFCFDYIYEESFGSYSSIWAEYGFNIPDDIPLLSDFNVSVEQELPYYTTVFGVDTLEANALVVSSDEVLDYFLNYKKSYHTGTVRGRYSADLFSSPDGTSVGDKIDRDDLGELPSYDDTHEKWWEGLLEYGLFYKPSEHDETVKALKIERVDPEDFSLSSFSEKFLVSAMDVEPMREYVADRSASDNTYLFRFAFDDDYYAAEGKLQILSATTGESKNTVAINGVITPVYLDFDILTLGFSDDGKKVTTFGVASSPIDVVPDVSTSDKNRDEFSTDGFSWLKYLIAIAFGVVLFFVLLRICNWLSPQKQYAGTKQPKPPKPQPKPKAKNTFYWRRK